MFADAAIRPWLATLRERVPGIELFDAHTHIGANDPDGYKCTTEELLDGLEGAGGAAARCSPCMSRTGTRMRTTW